MDQLGVCEQVRVPRGGGGVGEERDHWSNGWTNRVLVKIGRIDVPTV
jgi:hypothetical protein